MGYALGVDLGTTYTAAGVYRDGRVEIATLGNRSAAIPSVVLLKEDESILTGDAASRRGATEPGRVAREFKRRVGDSTPLFLGGSPYSAEALMAKLLRWVADEVASREGGPADAVAVCHPANWGPYKKDLLGQAVRIADLGGAALVTEPEAAAIHYASQERIDPGAVIAVYDLGGGTFDAAILAKTSTGFEILGEPEGIERLGGIDFDAAVFQHVARSLGGALEQLDEDDPTALAAVARLRQDCVEAKEALSTDTDTTIPVLLPSVQTEVRLTRSEFESMIRPALTDSIGAMQRALRSAGVAAGDVAKVLLVGGSSRIPLVAQLVGAELGRPVAVDAHPKHAIALGAALHAAIEGGLAGATGPVTADAGDDHASGAAGVGVGAAAVVGAAALADNAPVEAAAHVDTGPPAAAPPPTPHPAAPPPPATTAVPAQTAGGAPPPSPPAAPVPAAPPPASPPPPAPKVATVAPTVSVMPSELRGPGPAPQNPTAGGTAKKRKAPVGVIVAAVLVILALAAGLAFVLTSGGEDDPETDPVAAADQPDTSSGSTPNAGVTVTDCDIEVNEVCLTGVRLNDGNDRFVVDYDASFDPVVAAGAFHLHFFLNPPTAPDQAGSNGSDPGDWYLSDEASGLTVDPDGTSLQTVSDAQANGSTQLCVVQADISHAFVAGTGNCADIAGLL